MMTAWFLTELSHNLSTSRNAPYIVFLVFTFFVDIPDHIKGTYAALCYEPIIKHLKKMGVTAVELEPVHHHVDEKFLLDKVSQPSKLRSYSKSHLEISVRSILIWLELIF